MSGDVDSLVRSFAVWWDQQSHVATTAEAERLARELLSQTRGEVTQDDVDAHCAKLKRGFSGSRTILAASEVGEALLAWQRSAGPPRAAGVEEAGKEPSWSEADDALLDGVDADDLPPIPEGGLADASDDLPYLGDGDLPPLDDVLPPLDDAGGLPPASPPDDAPDSAPRLLSLDEQVDAIGGRDVFAASDPPPDGPSLDLDLDADMIGEGSSAHYVREEQMRLEGGRSLSVDVDPDAPAAQTADLLDVGAIDAGSDDFDADVPAHLAAGVPKSRASAAPVGRISSGGPPPSSAPAPSGPPDALPELSEPPPPDETSSAPLIVGVVVLLLLAAGAAVFLL